MPSLQSAYRANQWRTQKIAKGGGHFRGHEKLTTFFGKQPSGDLFLGERQLDDLFFFARDPNATSIVSPSLKFSKGGGHLPVHLFSCLLQAVKITFRQPKGGGSMDPWPPPRYATGANHTLETAALDRGDFAALTLLD
jgi:hypothetical protein